MFPQSGKFLGGGLMAAEYRGNRIGSFLNPLVEKGKEDIFLTVKIGIESATGIAGSGSDVLEASRLKTVPRENAFGGIEEFPFGCFGPLRLPQAGPDDGGGTHSVPHPLLV